MNQDQLNSIVRSVLKIAGAGLIQHGLTQQASLINSPDVAGLVVLMVGIWLSHQSHADPLLKAIADFAAGPTPPISAPALPPAQPRTVSPASSPATVSGAAAEAAAAAPAAPISAPATSPLAQLPVAPVAEGNPQPNITLLTIAK